LRICADSGKLASKVDRALMPRHEMKEVFTCTEYESPLLRR
jgi:hypothetical protein